MGCMTAPVAGPPRGRRVRPRASLRGWRRNSSGMNGPVLAGCLHESGGRTVLCLYNGFMIDQYCGICRGDDSRRAVTHLEEPGPFRRCLARLPGDHRRNSPPASVSVFPGSRGVRNEWARYRYWLFRAIQVSGIGKSRLGYLDLHGFQENFRPDSIDQHLQYAWLRSQRWIRVRRDDYCGNEPAAPGQLSM